jgi:hypothetical protein
VSESLDFARGMSDSSRAASEYWRNLYQKFNPPVNTTQSPDLSPGYGQANQMLQDQAAQSRARMAETGQSMGQFDPGMAGNDMASRLALQQMEQQQGMNMGNQAANTAAYQRQPVGQMGKMATIGAADQAMGRATGFGELGRFLTNENINRQWDNYKYGAKDPLASALGSFGGTFAGGLLDDAFNPNPADKKVNQQDIDMAMQPYYAMTGQFDKVGNKL